MRRFISFIGDGECECAGDLATSCSTAARVLPVQEWTDGMDNDCDGTVGEHPAAPPA